MSDVTNKSIVLKLNASWMPVGYCTIKKAIIDLTGGDSPDKTPNALALDIHYEKDENGEWDYDNPVYMNPLKWEDWISLPVRECDLAIHTTKIAIRAPLVLITPNYNKVPVKRPRPTKDAIKKRDNLQCQYTGRKLTNKEADIDHIIPVSRGGKNTFSNMVVSDININRMKADKTPQEAGLKLIRIPQEPPPIPISTTITDLKHPVWGPFLLKNR